MNILTVFKYVFDILLPKHCVGCGEIGFYCCNSCFNHLSKLIKTSKKIHYEIGLEKCYFDEIFICADYDKCELLRKLIWQFKYKYAKDLVAILAEILFLKTPPFTECLIVPVPLSRRKLHVRGFNQSYLLAKNLSLKFRNFTLCDCLFRAEGREDQAKLNRQNRLINLAGAFSLKAEYSPLIDGKDILLIDDVITTGTTLNECAKVLKSNGCRNVYGLVFMRAL